MKNVVLTYACAQPCIVCGSQQLVTQTGQQLMVQVKCAICEATRLTLDPIAFYVQPNVPREQQLRIKP